MNKEFIDEVLFQVGNGREAMYIIREYEHLFDEMTPSEIFIAQTMIASMVCLYEMGYEITRRVL
jgi:hypothetical protein